MREKCRGSLVPLIERGGRWGAILFLVMILPGELAAKVARIEILSRSDVLAGRSFGLAGPYEKVVGRIDFLVDPAHPANRRIVDLTLAPRNREGLVPFSADLYLLRPKQVGKGGRLALVEIANRGNKRLLPFFNRAAGSLDPTSEAEFGDGFLMEMGVTLVWVGWQFDVPAGEHLVRMIAPQAMAADGTPLRGWVRSDFVFAREEKVTSLGHRGQRAQPAIDLTDPSYRLTVRETVTGERRTIARADWEFARLEGERLVPDPTFLHLRTGFEPGRIYEVVYRTEGPTVVGLGLAAVRDLVSHLKYSPASPAPVEDAIGFGISQSGRFLRHFLYQGFNADEEGRRVFDGLHAHVAGGGHGSFNHRFAEPSRDGSPFSTFFYPTDIFPFTDLPQSDPETGETGGILAESMREQVVPKVFYTNSSYEYWGRAASLIHTSLDGEVDAELPSSTRIYLFTGGQHGPGPFPPRRAQTVHLTSPVDYGWSMRALLRALIAWVQDGVTPPESRYPRVVDGTLVRVGEVRFPAIPGVLFPLTHKGAWRIDYGPSFLREGRIDREPPGIGRPYGVRVPQVDRDGIDLGGIRLPEVAVPLATITGWNPRHPTTGAPQELVDFAGSYLPLPRVATANDPRLPWSARYPTREHYLGQVAEAALALIKEGYLLAEDLPSILDRAQVQWAWATQP
jgi:hypothetical protein